MCVTADTGRGLIKNRFHKYKLIYLIHTIERAIVYPYIYVLRSRKRLYQFRWNWLYVGFCGEKLIYLVTCLGFPSTG